jgi:hypothetical protein
MLERAEVQRSCNRAAPRVATELQQSYSELQGCAICAFHETLDDALFGFDGFL